MIRLSEADWATAVRHDQRAKGQRAVDDVDTDTDTLAGSGQKLGFLRVDYSGLDEKGMLPASLHHAGDTVHRPGMDFFAVLEKRLPPEVDACLLSAVGESCPFLSSASESTINLSATSAGVAFV